MNIAATPAQLVRQLADQLTAAPDWPCHCGGAERGCDSCLIVAALETAADRIEAGDWEEVRAAVDRAARLGAQLGDLERALEELAYATEVAVARSAA